MLREAKKPDKNEKRGSSDVVGFAILMLFGYFMAGFAVNIMHEAGHGIVCDLSGFQSRTFVDERGFHSACTGTPENEVLHNASGGLAGLAASGAMIGAKWVIKSAKYRIVVIGVGIIFALDQVVKIVLETGFTDAYLSGSFDMPITIFQVVTLLVVGTYIAKRRNKN